MEKLITTTISKRSSRSIISKERRFPKLNTRSSLMKIILEKSSGILMV
jgi:hypothetical protein